MTKMYCRECACSRTSGICPKCGYPTIPAHKDWVDPAMPPFHRIQQLAREVGYMATTHGSLERDLDVVAMPWTDQAVGNLQLMQHIATGLGGTIHGIERKDRKSVV